MFVRGFVPYILPESMSGAHCAPARKVKHPVADEAGNEHAPVPPGAVLDAGDVPEVIDPNIGIGAVGFANAEGDAPEVERRNRDLKAEAVSIWHLMTHFPKNKYCLTCQNAKCMRARHVTGAMSTGPVPKKFGDSCTADHIICRGDASAGYKGERDCVMLYDRATRWLSGVPVQTKAAKHAYKAITQFAGRQKIRFMHTDESKELIKACDDHGIVHETSPPGIPQSNGLAETMVRIEVEGGRCELSNAGFPPCFWPLAIQHFCFSRNIQLIDGDSSYNRRHKKGHFKGLVIPFGAQVEFRPIPFVEKDTNKPKFSDKAVPGVMLGYHLSPGGTWHGEYVVAALQEFVGMDLRVGGPVRTQRVKEVVFRPELAPLRFPFKAMYDQANKTLEGLSKPYRSEDPGPQGMPVTGEDIVPPAGEG